MRVVVALGGNALLPRGASAGDGTQLRNIRAAAASIADIARHHDVVVTHGNGPQIGFLAEASSSPDGPSLDVLGAETEGMIGYLLERELRNALPQRSCAGLLTQVLVDATDPAFRAPTKPIGPVYPRDHASALTDRGWKVGADDGGVRRVVPSPEPVSILEFDAIETLLARGAIVICAGGGGVPVVRDDDGTLRGVEAVVDKDLTAALLATALGADLLVLLTDVPAVMRDWGTTHATPIDRIDPVDAATLALDAGSMGPKVEAARRFVDHGGRRAAIGALREASALVDGCSGTQVQPASAGRPVATDHRR